MRSSEFLVPPLVYLCVIDLVIHTSFFCYIFLWNSCDFIAVIVYILKTIWKNCFRLHPSVNLATLCDALKQSAIFRLLCELAVKVHIQVILVSEGSILPVLLCPGTSLLVRHLVQIKRWIVASIISWIIM